MTAPQSISRTVDPRLAASQSLLPPGLVFSDTPSRIVAQFLDGLVLGAIVSIPAGLLGFYDFRYPGFPDRTTFAVVLLLGYLLQAFYFIWYWSGGRRGSPGQRVFGIQVANAFDGGPLSTRQAVKRFIAIGGWIGFPALLPVLSVAVLSYAVSTAYGLALLVSVLTTPTKQGLHDRWAGSAVVRPAAADTRWAKRVIWLVIALAAFEAFVLAASWSAMQPFMKDFWGEYIHWLWPS